MKRPEAWHDAYRAIYSTTGCIRLTVTQAAAQMGTSPKRVTQQYPDGWSGQGRGKMQELAGEILVNEQDLHASFVRKAASIRRRV